MAVMGMRPIVEFMFADFMPTAGDAIVNQLPKYRFMSGGQFSVPGDAARHLRCRRPFRHPAQRHRRVLVHGPAGPARRRGRHAGRSLRAAAAPPSPRTTRSSSTSTRCSTAARAPVTAGQSRRSARPASSGAARTSPSSPACSWSSVRCRRPRCWRPRASTSRSSTCAGCDRSTWRPSARRWPRPVAS